MTVAFMDAYVRLLIQTCHKRKVAAMGGMSAQIPIKNDPKANEVAMAKVRADKLREVTAGHDGTWIAHPLIEPIARGIFDQHMLGPNQVYCLFTTLVQYNSSLSSIIIYAKTSKLPLPISSTPQFQEKLLLMASARTFQHTWHTPRPG